MSSHLIRAAALIVDVAALAAGVLFVLRFLVQLLRTDYYNPLTQTVLRLSDPLLEPLRRVLPAGRRLDCASLLAAWAVQGLRLLLLSGLAGAWPPAGGLLVLAAAQLIQLILHVFSFAILAVVILSWINPFSPPPASRVFHELSEPLLRPIRRFLPPLAGLDLSPLLALVLLQLLALLVVEPLRGAVY